MVASATYQVTPPEQFNFSCPEELKKEGDPHLALLSYRAIPLQCGYSPSELLTARKIRTKIPMTHKQLKPKVPDQSCLRETDERA